LAVNLNGRRIDAADRDVTGFDQYASTYRATVQSSVDFAGLDYGFFVQAKAACLKAIAAARFGRSARPSLLDVGCGVGTLHPLLTDSFGEIHGVDQSVESIERARRQNPGVQYRVSAGPGLPYRSGHFDLVTAICVVHHVAPADWPNFVAELKRVTRPGGLVCLVEHNPFNPLTRLAVLRCPFDEEAQLLSARRARSLLREVGLGRVRSEHFLLLPSAAPRLRAVERWLGCLPLGAQYVAWGECG
jgi:SAM-dependent methyltransferase